MKDIAIIGAGGFGREVLMLIEQINEVHRSYNFVGYFDDSNLRDSSNATKSIIGNIEDLNNYQKRLFVVVAIGSPEVKRKIISRITNKNVFYETLIHPSCYVGSDSNIGEGAIICGGCFITTNVKIGKHVILNLCTTVGHDTAIGHFTSVMPGVNISGEVKIDDEVYIGTGAKIINKVNIGNGALIGAGSVVVKEILSNTTAFGVPAKMINK
jgi:sugar O-acyltransferase (sialic acid O-acetyltransferase NeuD family)